MRNDKISSEDPVIPPLFTDGEMSRWIAAQGPFFSFRLNLSTAASDYLAILARSVWSRATGCDLAWPAGLFPQVYCNQLQRAGITPSSKTVMTVSRTPGRALMAMSLLPAFRMFSPQSGRSMLMAARTERLARVFRARWQAVQDEENAPRPGDARTVVSWTRVGAPLRTKPLSDLVICDPLADEELKDPAACRALTAWMASASRAGRWEDGAEPSTLLVIDDVEGSVLSDMLVAAGWTHVNLPRFPQQPITLPLSRVKDVTIPARQLFVPLPADSVRARRLKADGWAPTEIEAVLT